MRPGSLSLSAFENRVLGISATILLHVALLVAWQAASRQRLPDDNRTEVVTQWVRVPVSVPVSAPQTSRVAPADKRAPTPAPIARTGDAVGPDSGQPAPVANIVPSGDAPAVMHTEGSAHKIVEQARSEAGAIDRALRKSSNPYIVAPRDSAHIRMARGFAEAAALAPNRWWEAPKVVELVNDGGDGARRTRVVTAAGIYCITERSPTTSIDVIEKFGRQRITNCGHEHEQPANAQEWRTARD